MEKYTPNLKVTKVMWECPSPGWVKVNIDGASRGNPGRSSIEFVLRNEDGDIIYACGKEIQEGTNYEAEARAMLEALRYCIKHDYVLIDLHTDSMMLKKVVSREWNAPWAIAIYVEEIK
uniref:14.7 kDa ribonuclease H-like protein n=1 Tax=Nicotiana tabacum TaxID=4097 RepID=A0A1S3XGU5_TOBAC|nr:PREDICTED: 14.7 kDa ribonuclease H-like protein [Nicotiana tabacum]